MMEAAPREIAATDLKLLGRFYQNDLPLVLDMTPDSVSIVPPRSAWKSMVVLTSLIGLVYGGFMWVAIANDAGARFGPMIWLLLLIIGVLAIGGPVVGHQLRLRYLRSISPLVSFSASEMRIAILGGAHVFPVDDFYALLGLTLRDPQGEPKSELQLIIRQSGAFAPYLISTDLSGSAGRSYGKILRQFGHATGLRTLIAEPEDLLGRGPLGFKDLS